MIKFIKYIFIILAVSVLAAGIYIYINRSVIFDHNINRIIKNIMPSYIDVQDIKIDLDKKNIVVKDFKIQNPAGFKSGYLIEVAQIRCSLNQQDEKNLLKGLKLTNIELDEPALLIERLKDSSVNIQHMDKVFKQHEKPKKVTLGSKIIAFFWYIFSPIKSIDDFLQIDPVVKIKNGKFIFDDSLIYETGYRTSVERINAEVDIGFNKGFNEINYIESEGTGLINGRPGQILQWSTGYNPKASRLTMSNTLSIKDADFIHFEPYYNKFSPISFKSGRASGELVFNFDNGNIGSTNEIRFSGLVIEPKSKDTAADLWDVGINDLYKYFSAASGEVVFDFKIKGSIEEPKFYLGTKTKRALTMMVMDKVTNAIFKNTEGDSGGIPGQGAPESEKSDLEKVIDIFKNLRKSD